MPTIVCLHKMGLNNNVPMLAAMAFPTPVLRHRIISTLMLVS